MKTIRRIYFYIVAFISLEVVLWGMIGLARSIFSNTVGGGVDQLSQALALILVGVPVFGIHWQTAQRSASKDAEEYASAIRALFLYGALLGSLIPLTQNGLAFINRLIIDLFNIPTSHAMLGGYQSLSDNFIAALMNGLVAAYFIYILRDDWENVSNKSALALTRRIYRYIWVLYSLIMSIIGINQILRYLFSYVTDFSHDNNYYGAMLANGLALILVGIPLWVWAWKTVQSALQDPAERASLLRLGMLYIFSLSGVLFVLTTTGIVISEFIQFLLKETNSFRDFFQAIEEPLAVAIPLGAVWAYYGNWLKRDLDALPNAPRRDALNRLYYYILSFIGLFASFTGVAMLLSFLIDSAFGTSIWNGSLETRLADSLATLFVSLPLWLKTWFPRQTQALALDERGDHARRSGIRKTYLYFALFVGVVGGMISAVRLISLLLQVLLGTRPIGFTDDFLNALQMFLLFSGLLAYHWKSLQRDGILRGELNYEKADKFTALLFDNGEETLLPQLASIMESESAGINLILQNPAEKLKPAEALLLPLDLALNPSEMLTTNLRAFNGSKFLLPREADDWYWMQDPKQIAKSLRQLAEGEKIKESRKTPGWMVLVYILAAVMVAEIIFFLAIIAFNGF